jgi:hypothetical protein
MMEIRIPAGVYCFQPGGVALLGPSLSVEYKTDHRILIQIVRAGLFPVTHSSFKTHSIPPLFISITMRSNFMLPFTFLVIVLTSIIPANAAPVYSPEQYVIPSRDELG